MAARDFGKTADFLNSTRRWSTRLSFVSLPLVRAPNVRIGSAQIHGKMEIEMQKQALRATVDTSKEGKASRQRAVTLGPIRVFPSTKNPPPIVALVIEFSSVD
ncbi:hypothetical protein HZH66_005447 [Vespula vulgaris]|uniref:Uncharacterized protein n=1 Tax=Vespula vulgaris TaxID=7454 RepID=A0A834NAG7_VESVU|nr:hypothetical protein HZH66_005447 [Vespula vulgaris]